MAIHAINWAQTVFQLLTCTSRKYLYIFTVHSTGPVLWVVVKPLHKAAWNMTNLTSLFCLFLHTSFPTSHWKRRRNIKSTALERYCWHLLNAWKHPLVWSIFLFIYVHNLEMSIHVVHVRKSCTFLALIFGNCIFQAPV